MMFYFKQTIAFLFIGIISVWRFNLVRQATRGGRTVRKENQKLYGFYQLLSHGFQSFLIGKMPASMFPTA